MLKFEPPLIVKKEEVDYYVESLDKVLDEDKNELSLAINTLIKAGSHILD